MDHGRSTDAARSRCVLTLFLFYSAATLVIFDRAHGQATTDGITRVRLHDESDPASQDHFRTLADDFERRHPGYRIEHRRRIKRLVAMAPTVAFVQRIDAGRGDESHGVVAGHRSSLTVGDVVVLRRGERLLATPPVDLVVFEVPSSVPSDLPAVIRPDHDPKITDTPGGCATERGAYRRIALTWLRDKGPYVWHALNSHRVRIEDSFTHYHPADGGFDEFYLVQMARPESRLISSTATEDILRPHDVDRAEAATLLHETKLEVGDLVYIPRGVTHRGVGGVLAHVITVPGFRPGAEIGVDRQLHAINERLGLSGEDALPFHRNATQQSTTSDSATFDSTASRSSSGIKLERRDDCVHVTIDGDLFTEYRFRDVSVPLCHPVIGAAGRRVTRNYPLASGFGESKDHPHHCGLWYAHGDVDGIDFWHPKSSRGGHVEHIEFLDTTQPATLRTRNRWIANRTGETILTDCREIRFHRNGTTRFIDFTIILMATEGDVTFGDTKEGTMAIRLHPRLRLRGPIANGVAVNSEDVAGAAVWGKRAAWVDYSGEIDGKVVGVAIVDHPKNPAHPTWWHARDYGLFAANPFGVYDFEGESGKTGAMPIKHGETVTFRYRVVLHEGTEKFFNR